MPGEPNPKVAEFERDLIRERTRLGIEKAEAAGKHIGRPRLVGPPPAEVRRLRSAGKSWREVASELRCSTWAARCAVG